MENCLLYMSFQFGSEPALIGLKQHCKCRYKDKQNKNEMTVERLPNTKISINVHTRFFTRFLFTFFHDRSYLTTYFVCWSVILFLVLPDTFMEGKKN